LHREERQQAALLREVEDEVMSLSQRERARDSERESVRESERASVREREREREREIARERESERVCERERARKRESAREPSRAHTHTRTLSLCFLSDPAVDDPRERALSLWLRASVKSKTRFTCPPHHSPSARAEGSAGETSPLFYH